MNHHSDLTQKIQNRLNGLAEIRVVLVRTSHPGNVGQVARAMANMGLSELYLTSPRFADMCAQPDAISLASGATDVLAQAQIVPDLQTALQGVNYAYAFSARPRDLAPPMRTSGEAASEVMQLFDAAFQMTEPTQKPKIAFVFGAERSGLVNDEVMMCQRLCQIEANPDYNSLNLAQAVQVMTYSLRQAALHAEQDQVTAQQSYALHTPKLSTEIPQQQQPAEVSKVEGMLTHWEQMLVALEVLNPDIPSETMTRLRALFARAELSNNEVNFLRGIARAVLERTEVQN